MNPLLSPHLIPFVWGRTSTTIQSSHAASKLISWPNRLILPWGRGQSDYTPYSAVIHQAIRRTRWETHVSDATSETDEIKGGRQQLEDSL
ncbi:hypothetical protein Pmani_015637 [Petrolisthes manimaculis]|uniref:Uncharacterized protein n=1 Tax=Petrolisthes manimaculis TaxID=1843537 RepID=A0AAE1PTG7_9EUCA|nr:hypothetical protein Pmani_015637 [Petrolisthes manimaculis]